MGSVMNTEQQAELLNCKSKAEVLNLDPST